MGSAAGRVASALQCQVQKQAELCGVELCPNVWQCWKNMAVSNRLDRVRGTRASVGCVLAGGCGR